MGRSPRVGGLILSQVRTLKFREPSLLARELSVLAFQGVKMVFVLNKINKLSFLQCFLDVLI